MATLKDVAERAGITVTTVSPVLNDRGYISQQTREKVYQAMKDLNYQPNEAARSLSKKRMQVIGVIVPSVMHPFFSKVVNYLEYYASLNRYKIMLCNSFHQRDKEAEYLEMLRSNKVSGIVLCSRTEETEAFSQLDMPLITFERSIAGDIPFVGCDNYQGGQLATEHLYGKGCRILAHIGGTIDVSMPADARRQGFLDTCARYGLQGTVFNTYEAQFQAMEYQEYIVKILRENPQFDGIFASSDVIAAQVLQACSLLGIRVPQDLKLVGFDDVEVASLTTPKITTIRQPVEEMCHYAVSNILHKLEQKVIPNKTVLPVQLIERETT